MLSIETLAEIARMRVEYGLPTEAVPVPESLVQAVETGRINADKDLHPNMCAVIRSAYPVPKDLEPRLTIHEEIERTRAIGRHAAISTG